MAAKNGLKVFLDTSVIFAAVLSPSGGARKLFHLAAAGVLTPVISPEVLRECEEVVRRKAPSSLPLLAQLLAVGRVEISSAPTARQIRRAELLVKYLPDARVLAGAMQACPEWFVTHDREHFLKIRSAGELPFSIGTPGDLIQALADHYRS